MKKLAPKHKKRLLSVVAVLMLAVPSVFSMCKCSNTPQQQQCINDCAKQSGSCAADCLFAVANNNNQSDPSSEPGGFDFEAAVCYTKCAQVFALCARKCKASKPTKTLNEPTKTLVPKAERNPADSGPRPDD